jgi:hypothetical protein
MTAAQIMVTMATRRWPRRRLGAAVIAAEFEVVTAVLRWLQQRQPSAAAMATVERDHDGGQDWWKNLPAGLRNPKPAVLPCY